jgi:hypothetical protein
LLEEIRDLLKANKWVKITKTPEIKEEIIKKTRVAVVPKKTRSTTKLTITK